MIFEKDDLIEGPNGLGFKVTRDIRWGDELYGTDFLPLGDTPPIEMGTILPQWFVEALHQHLSRQRDG